MDNATFVANRSSATLPFGSTDLFEVIQGGLTKQVPALSIGGNVNWTFALNLNANSTNPLVPLSLTAQFNLITQSIGGAYVQLNQTLVQLIIVANYGGADIFVLPPSGSQINNLGVNAPYTVIGSAGGSAQLFFPAPGAQAIFSLIP